MAEAQTKTVKDLIDLLGGASNVAKYEALKSYLLDEDEEINDADAPYEEAYRRIITDPNVGKELVKGFKPFLKRVANVGEAQKRGEKGVTLFSPLPLNMDNVVQALSEATAVKNADDILSNKSAYADINGGKMKSLFNEYGWDMPTVMDYIRNEQTKAARQKIYDDTNLLTKMMFPRTTEALRTSGDYEGKDLGLDVAENLLQLIPIGGVAGKIGASGLRYRPVGKAVMGSVPKYLLENASVPTVMAAADYLAHDDKSVLDAIDQALTGTAINAAAGKMITGGISGLARNPKLAKALEDALKQNSDAFRNKVSAIDEVLLKGRSASPEEYKRALNMRTILENPDLFSRGKKGNLTDYAGKTSKDAKIGQSNKARYEAELALKHEEPWAKSVNDRVTSYLNDPIAETQFARLNREATFPHNYIDPDKVGFMDGVIRVQREKPKGSTWRTDDPEFNTFNRDYLDEGHTVRTALEDVADEHKSRKFQYPIEIDRAINDYLSDQEFVDALKYVYGKVNPRDVPISYFTNKLGRSDWLREQKSAAKRLFGELVEDDKKKEEE